MKGDVIRTGVSAAVLLASCACSPSPSRGVSPNDTQVVAQWLIDGKSNTLVDAVTLGFRNVRTEQAIESACSDVCFDDGNDVGGGTFNVYLYTHNVPATVRLLVKLEKSGSVPLGLRVGVARYRDAKKRDWSYAAVYPTGLRVFDLTYKKSS